MKKLMMFLITMITLTNISYAAFPVISENVIDIDTIILDTNEIVKKKLQKIFYDNNN